MFLKEIELNNFRCIDNLKINFLDEKDKIRSLTLFLGENGTGKSTILKAIALITAGSDAIGELLGEPSDWIKKGKDDCEICAILTNKNKENRKLRLYIKRGDTLRDIILRCEASLAEIDNALNHTNRNYFVLAYGASRRLNHNSNFSVNNFFRSNRAKNLATLFNLDAILNPLESWAMDLDYRNKEKGANIVQKTLDEFLPGIQFNSIDREKKKLLFETRDGIVPLEFLSDGYQNMAAWIGDLMYRVSETFKDYTNPLNTRGLLMIDEVDLHIHPQWQRKLLDFLREKLPNFQIITTTHSPLTAQQTSEGELFYLTRKENDISLEEFTASPKRLLIHQLILSGIFGLETDESFENEQLKERYKKLKKQSKRTEKEERELKKLKQIISSFPPPMYANLTPPEHIDLLRKIDVALNKV